MTLVIQNRLIRVDLLENFRVVEVVGESNMVVLPVALENSWVVEVVEESNVVVLPVLFACEAVDPVVFSCCRMEETIVLRCDLLLRLPSVSCSLCRDQILFFCCWFV